MRRTNFIMVLLLIWKMIPVSSFVFTTQEKKYAVLSCPVIPTFDNVAYLSGMTIELPCKCMPEPTSKVIWYYKRNSYSPNIRLLTSFAKQVDEPSLHVESKVTTKLSNVIIHKTREKDSGLYMCGSEAGDFYWGYEVDIQDASEAYVAFHERKQKPLPDLVTSHLTAFTAFWEWSKCDRCDVFGEQQRIGLCYIKSNLLDLRFKIAEKGFASCGSEAVTPILLKELADRKPEIYYRGCEVPCHIRKEGIRGTIDYWWHNMVKLSDWISWMPKAPTETYTHTIGNSLTLSCPGARPQDAVAWDKGNRRLYRSDYLIGQKKTDRIYIDFGNNLNFRYVSFSDQDTYYCWLQGKLKSAIQLAVTVDPTKQRTFGDAESTLAINAIGTSFGFFILIFVVVHCIKCSSYNLKCAPCGSEKV